MNSFSNKEYHQNDNEGKIFNSDDMKIFEGIHYHYHENEEHIRKANLETVHNPRSSESEHPNKSTIDIDNLVQEVKNKIYTDIQSRCGTMKVLDMTRPIGLCDIYTDVNILETITGRRRLGISDLLKNFDPESENFDRRGLGQITEERVPGLQVVNQYSRLIVLGKPGAGKTTFLKYIALQSIWGKFQAGRIPIFVTLKVFSEEITVRNLLSYIEHLFNEHGVSKNQVARILENGRAIVLLDGLDEVREEDSKRVLKEISSFSNKFFLSKVFKNDRESFISERDYQINEIKKQSFKLEEWYKNIELRRGKITNSERKLLKQLERLKIQYDEGKLPKGEYQQQALQITIEQEELRKEHLEFEPIFIADIEKIDQEKKKLAQAQSLVESEFPDISQYSDQGLEFLSKKFPDRFYNNQFLITCRIAAKEYKFEKFVEVEVADFDDQQVKTFTKNWFSKKNQLKSDKFIQKLADNQYIRELASNPLLLTLLCLVFEDSASFSSNRSQLYKDGVSILLKRWDADRLIERQQIYQNLYPARKEDLLSHIAQVTFEAKDYFFRQSAVELYISEYIQNLPDAKTDPEALRLDSEAVLKSIEAQHGLLIERAKGIYSFSHLTFQEYFTARKIVMTSDPITLSKNLESFVKHITERRWIEVFLLAVGMSPNADYLIRLMKQQVDSFLANDKKIQEFLAWIHKKVLKIELPIDNLVAKVFYFAIYSDPKLAISIARSRTSSNYRQIFNNLIHHLSLASNIKLNDKSSIESSYLKDQIYQLINTLNKSITFATLLHEELIKGIDQTFKIKDFRTTNLSLAYSLNPELAHIQALITTLDSEPIKMLKELKKQLPNNCRKDDELKSWWTANEYTWTKMLNQVLTAYQNLGKDWQFNEEQRNLLQLYCDANKLIVDCLRTDCYVSHNVRHEVEQTLLMPVVKSEPLAIAP